MLPELARQQIAAIGMKSLGGDGRVIKKKVARVEDALRYAMSLPVCTTVSGIDSLKVLRQNLRIARRLLADDGAAAPGVRTESHRRVPDGRFELYKTTAEHEGDVGREQHGFPSQDEVAM